MSFWNKISKLFPKTPSLSGQTILKGDAGETLFRLALDVWDRGRLVAKKEFVGTPWVKRLEALEERVEALRKSYEQSSASWTDLTDIQILATEAIEEDLVPLELGNLRSEYKTVASHSAQMEYEVFARTRGSIGTPPTAAGVPPPPHVPGTRPAHDREELRYLARAIYTTYAIRAEQEARRAWIAWLISKNSLTVILCIIAIGLWVDKPDGVAFPFLFLIAISGTLGAWLSSSNRVQETVGREVAILTSTRYVTQDWNFIATPLGGAVFSTIFFLIYQTGFVSFSFASQGNGPKICLPSGEEYLFLFHPPCTATEISLLLILGFMAGFAERLVPDTLDRLVGSMKTAKAEEIQK